MLDESFDEFDCGFHTDLVVVLCDVLRLQVFEIEPTVHRVGRDCLSF